MKFKYELEIDIDEKNISKKYPNYDINYSTPKEFADSLAFSNLYENDIDLSNNGYILLGYSIKVKNIL